MGLFGNLWHGIQTIGLPPIYLTDNPRVHASVLGAIALSFAITLLRLIQTRRVAALRELGFSLLVIVLAWLGFSTPPDQLFGFAPSGATTIAAWAVHSLLALLPLALVVIWLLQLGLSPLRLPGIAIELVACALLIAGLESLRWPGDLVAILEALISVVVFFALAVAAAKIIHNATLWRALTLASFGVWGAALVLLLFAHAIQSPLVALCLLFLAIVCLDGLTGTGAWRFVVTVPLVLAAGLLGAANVFAPYSLAPGLSAGVWLEAASAGAAFLFVAALFDWAKHQIDKQLSDEQKRVHDERHAASAAQWLLDLLTGQGKKRQAQVQADLRHLRQVAHVAKRLRVELDGITAAFFFTILVAYYLLVYAAANLSDPIPLLRPIAGATLITIAGIVLNQIVAMSVRQMRALKDAPKNDILHDPIFKSLWKIVQVFLYLVLGLYGLGGQLGSIVTQGDCSDPGNTSCILIDKLNGLTHTAGVAPYVLLGNGSFWIAAGRIALGAALVLLALGQLRFAWVVDKVKKAEAGDKGGDGSVQSAGAGANANSTSPSAPAPAERPAAAAQPEPAAVPAGAGVTHTN